MSFPLVSAIIPTCHRYELAKIAIDSVRQQTYEPLQIIVVEDGSDSGIEDYIRQCKDPRLVYYRHPTRRGLPAARNTGTELAEGEYVAFLDDDDAWLPEKIEQQVECLSSRSEQRCIVYCGVYGVAPDGRIQGETIQTVRGAMAPHIFRGYLLPQSSLLIPREPLLALGGHSEELVSCVDHDLWMKLAQAGFEMEVAPEPLVYVNNHQDPSRMIKNLDTRLQGIAQFFEKWRAVVVDAYGLSAWHNIEEVYYRQLLKTIKHQYLHQGLPRREALAYLHRFLKLQSRRYPWLDYLAFKAGLVSLMPLDRRLKSLPGYPQRVLERHWSR